MAQQAAIINQQQQQPQASPSEKVNFQQVLTAFHLQEQSFGTELRTASPDANEQGADFADSESRDFAETSISDGGASKTEGARDSSEEGLNVDTSTKNSEREPSSDESSKVAHLSPLQILLSRGFASAQQGQTGEGKPEAEFRNGQTARESASKPNDGILWAAKTAIKGKPPERPADMVSDPPAETGIQDANTIPSGLPDNALKMPLNSMKEQPETSKVGSLRRAAPSEEGTLTTSVDKAAVVRPVNANLAFAVRLTPDGDAASHEKPENPALSQDTPAIDLKPAHSFSLEGDRESRDAAKSADHPEENLSIAALCDSPAPTQDGEAVSDSQACATNSPVFPDAFEQEPSGPQGNPVRDVNFQVSGGHNQRVEIRLLEIGGEMRVSVRSADAGLARSLQDRIPELTTRLDQEHFRSEVWIPKTSVTGGQGHLNGKPGQEGQPSEPDGERKQRNHREQDHPDWVDELETRPRGGQTLRSN